MTDVAPPGDQSPEPHQPHILDQIVEENAPKQNTSPQTDGPPSDDGVPKVKEPEGTSTSAPSSPPVSMGAPFEQEEGKYVCKLERKKSSIRRKRVLTAVTADDNKPVHIPLVEYGDQHATYTQISERVMYGADVTHGIRLLREKMGVLTAIRDVCQRKIDVRLSLEERQRRRIRIKRGMVVWTYGFVFMSGLVVVLKILFLMAKAYYGLIRDHIHQFRA